MFQRLNKTLRRSAVEALAGRGFYRVAPGSPEFTRRNNTREAINEFYSDANEIRDYLSPSRLDFYREVADIVTRQRSATGLDVADVGCGTGHLLALFDGSRRVGFDFSEAGLQVARKVCPDADFVEHDIYDPIGEQFDVVLCCEVLEHLYHPDRALQNVAQMARPGGLVLLTVPNGRIDTYIGHINFWSPESWQVFLGDRLPDFAITTETLDRHRCLYATLER